jgi:hypothetical protein
MKDASMPNGNRNQTQRTETVIICSRVMPSIDPPEIFSHLEDYASEIKVEIQWMKLKKN